MAGRVPRRAAGAAGTAPSPGRDRFSCRAASELASELASETAVRSVPPSGHNQSELPAPPPPPPSPPREEQ